MSFDFRSKRRQGFTLIEVLISMALLVFITFGVTQIIAQAFKMREVILVEGDFYNEIRLALSVVERDVIHIYSPTLMLPQAKKAAPGAPPLPPEPPMDPRVLANQRSGPFWMVPVHKSGIKPSRFQGEARKMSFISASHIRLYKATRETEFLKVTYELKDDSDGPAEVKTVNGKPWLKLVRTVSTNAFDDEDENRDPAKKEVVLLKGITGGAFRFFKKDRDRWETTWDTDREDFKYLYPDRVEVKLDVLGPQSLSFDAVYVFRPEMPLRGLTPSF